MCWSSLERAGEIVSIRCANFLWIAVWSYRSLLYSEPIHRALQCRNFQHICCWQHHCSLPLPAAYQKVKVQSIWVPHAQLHHRAQWKQLLNANSKCPTTLYSLSTPPSPNMLLLHLSQPLQPVVTGMEVSQGVSKAYIQHQVGKRVMGLCWGGLSKGLNLCTILLHPPHHLQQHSFQVRWLIWSRKKNFFKSPKYPEF